MKAKLLIQSSAVAVLTCIFTTAKLCGMVGAGNEMGTNGGGVGDLPILPTEIFYPDPVGEQWSLSISDLRIEGPLNADELIEANPIYQGLKSERYDLPYGATYKAADVPLIAGGIYEYSYPLHDPFVSSYGGEHIALIGFIDGLASAETGPIVEIIEDLTKKLSPEDNYIGARVRLLKVEFETFPDDVPGPDKAHKINMSTRQNEAAFYGDFEKFVAYVYKEGNLNLIDYLDGADDPNMRQIFEDNLRWRSNGTDVPHELNFVLEPQDNEVRIFEIEVLPKESDHVLDRLIITVVPRSTKSAFDAWKSANQNTGWLAELPPLYSSIEAGQDPDENCNPRIWESPGDTDSYYHPAAQFAMRSEETQNGHGHQACYDGSRSLIRAGVSAGTADKAHPSNLVGSDSHKNQDVLPFIWALQLDGNPVEGGTLNLNLTQPIAHEGVFSNEYLGLRPPIANAAPELQPGTCP